jgi:hypothetical protein
VCGKYQLKFLNCANLAPAGSHDLPIRVLQGTNCFLIFEVHQTVFFMSDKELLLQIMANQAAIFKKLMEIEVKVKGGSSSSDVRTAKQNMFSDANAALKELRNELKI